MEVGNEVEINGVLYVRKNVKVEKTLSCQKEWKERCGRRAEGDKLRAESDKLYAEGSKLYAEGRELRAEGDKLYAEGDLIFINAVIKTFGNIKLEWKNWHDDKHSYECHLDNGEVYIPV